jgi:hypothetical protein
MWLKVLAGASGESFDVRCIVQTWSWGSAGVSNIATQTVKEHCEQGDCVDAGSKEG